MRKLFLFMMVSLDGFFEGQNHDLSWHHVDAEFNEFAIKQLHEVDTILFGRKTYNMMASYWTTPSAVKDDPVVARLMNETPKMVFSKTLDTVEWSNTVLVKEAGVKSLKKLKEQPGKDLAIFGSNNLATHLLEEGLLDEIRIMVNPVILGDGNRLFKDVQEKFVYPEKFRRDLNLSRSIVFKNGNVLLVYSV